jgi:hypothetical protein
MSSIKPASAKPTGDYSPADADDTPEYPLAAPIKPDDPERRTEQSKAETAGCVEERKIARRDRDKGR